MAAHPFERSAWPSSNPPASRVGTEVWQSTRVDETSAPTQILQDPSDYLESVESQPDIGRAVGDDTRELFVSCDPALALEQQFQHLAPQYIALHDIGASVSRKLLVSIAVAAGRKPQKLLIRRQGYGTTLATVEFVDCPASNGKSVRLYSTEVDADMQARQAMARTLLAHSTLGVLMVGDLPAHALSAAFKPLREAMVGPGWTCRSILVLPLTASSAVSSQAAEMTLGTGVDARTTPQIARPADAWGFMGSTWNRLQDQAHPGGGGIMLGRLAASTPVSAPASTPANTRPGDLRPASPATPMPIPGASPRSHTPLDRYVHELIEIAGMVSCCVFDVAAGRAMAHAGAKPAADALARQGSEILLATMGAGRSLGLGGLAVPDLTVTLAQHHLLLRAVPGHPGLALHAVLDKLHVNLAVARTQIQKLEQEFGGRGATSGWVV
ncbi:MAG TPA: hypothetical protein VFV25_11445 [Methylibium sp.]